MKRRLEYYWLNIPTPWRRVTIKMLTEVLPILRSTHRGRGAFGLVEVERTIIDQSNLITYSFFCKDMILLEAEHRFL